ncbi:glycosyltransferase family 4 protein [Streptomyces lunaelactis]|uniref:glycosyltransferase family 4 protein n=1 Tax=Streptomyces lunaelactis TaxID=1535768 RepID=UPI0015849F92|nr:glycosyltransferase family 4 protein [Streptomyces lunaelactis]NUK34790.1 glycosyltransferase family 4 protein [Streptomyces lunaelactis]NUK41509.1 glycosyltransferase family 4 protein [Streptomyces lunaelactis]NUK91836.1 glycosyltransferase family 4 protein [Streptomyces lunaelactis]NUL28660.1 glycosyltransferase family 4 protein [Streptomyces lunaelactis]
MASDSTEATARPGSRGRIVMLVDNSVHGDSRVQKQAASAAAVGWDVILLGKYSGKGEDNWKLGDAEVRLIHMRAKLSVKPRDLRNAPLRLPLAYSSERVADFRVQLVKAWRADLRVRGDELKVADGRSKLGTQAAKTWLAVPKLASKVTSRWVSLRRRETKRLGRIRRTRSAPLDKLTTEFWLKTMGNRAWRRLDPGVWDFELSYGPVIDELKPDIIHANDFRMLGVGSRAALRARGAGRPVKLVWDAHEFLPGVRSWANKRKLPAMVAYEREHAKYADAVMTVSGGLADLLQKSHKLAERPAVVLNAPDAAATHRETDEQVPDIRELCGIDSDDVPLLVYSGLAAAQRGLGIMVEGLPEIPKAHVVFVCGDPEAPYVQGLLRRADELGVQERVHAVPYVPHWQVVPFLSGANVGVIPIHHWPNHEIALITKFFEYSHARLPLVVSDVKTMAEVASETGQGEVFKAEDVADYVRAVKAVLADPQKYSAVYDTEGLLEEWTWEAQAKVLDEVYTRLLQGGGR